VGDLVQTPELQSEWEIASAAQQTLEWTVPYSVLPGNHDIVQATGNDTYYNQYFGPQRFTGQSFYGGHEGTKNNNNYCYFEGGGMDFMVLSLEFEPTASTLVWANQVVAAHPNHRIIVATHSYLLREDQTDSENQGLKPEGHEIWDNLVKGNDNIFMVVCGHVPGWNHRVSTNDFGNPVVEILTDYQWEPDGLSSAQYAGNGWMNLMNFRPEDNQIDFMTYSPYLGQLWTGDPLHEYTIDYMMSFPGDANRDGVVDASDATILAGNWQAGPGASWLMGDFNGDGYVNASDATILAGNWQSGSSNAIPEPSTLVLLFGLALGTILVWRKRVN
jgi:3',5'-cyclic AMP phosphodiesterase CpdA